MSKIESQQTSPIVAVPSPSPSPAPTTTPLPDWFGEAVLVLTVAGAAVVRQVILPAISKWSNRALGKRAYKHDMRIQQILAECIGRTNACRALLYEFHNGGKLASGRHYERVSVINQYCPLGSSLITEIKDVPFSLVSAVIDELTAIASPDSIPHILRSFDNRKASDQHTILMRAYGVHASVIFLLLDERREIGLVEVQFKEQLPSEILEKEIEELKPQVIQILLELRRAAASYSVWQSISTAIGSQKP